MVLVPYSLGPLKSHRLHLLNPPSKSHRLHLLWALWRAAGFTYSGPLKSHGFHLFWGPSRVAGFTYFGPPQ